MTPISAKKATGRMKASGPSGNALRASNLMIAVSAAGPTPENAGRTDSARASGLRHVSARLAARSILGHMALVP
jgi:hypothetical protein